MGTWYFCRAFYCNLRIRQSGYLIPDINWVCWCITWGCHLYLTFDFAVVTVTEYLGNLYVYKVYAWQGQWMGMQVCSHIMTLICYLTLLSWPWALKYCLGFVSDIVKCGVLFTISLPKFILWHIWDFSNHKTIWIAACNWLFCSC